MFVFQVFLIEIQVIQGVVDLLLVFTEFLLLIFML